MSVPCQTLYITNINDKVRKPELKRSLYLLCSQFGTVLDIVARKTPSTRGQAFVCFSNINEATEARRYLMDMDMYGKKLAVFYAKTNSAVVDPSVALRSSEIHREAAASRLAVAIAANVTKAVQLANGGGPFPANNEGPTVERAARTDEPFADLLDVEDDDTLEHVQEDERPKAQQRHRSER